MPARTAACVHARWHEGGPLSRGDLLVGGPGPGWRPSF